LTLRVAVFASGRGTNFEVLVAASRRGSGPAPRDDEASDVDGTTGLWKVALLVTDRSQAEAIDRAAARGIPAAVISPEDDPTTFAARILARLAEGEVDIVLLAGYLRLVPVEVVKKYRNRMLNLHPALLPRFGGRGMYGARVHEAVLESGSRITGATVHFVDEVYDTGRILAQWPVPVLSGDTPGRLAARVQEIEHVLYPAAVDALAEAIAGGSSVAGIPARGRHFLLSSNLPEFP
jgi:phosphoribosylglycinamide formyltransferase-1